MKRDPRFAYDPLLLVPPRTVSEHVHEDLLTRLMVLHMPDGRRRMAELIRPAADGDFAAVLFVHWYEPAAQDSNRTQFREEARRLALAGAVCLLVETMWSDPDWFYKRTQAEDIANTIRQVVELRVACDVLLAEPGVDADRFACVGHDFGAMHAVLLGEVDARATAYVLMAGTPRFADWYLYYPKLEEEAARVYRDRMKPYDPIEYAAGLSPAPLFFQFGRQDEHISIARAESFFDAAKSPKELTWYDCGHGLNEKARADRLDWLLETLRLCGGINHE